MKQLHDILNTFDPVSLEEMDRVKLMNRVDTKFVFPLSRLAGILDQLRDEYQVLEVNHHRVSRYESLYFDTPEFDLYHNHHRGKMNRFKIRFRKYVESELNFFEVKFKNNKGRTIKDRVKQPQINDKITDHAQVLLKEKTSLPAEELEAKIWVNYSRITLVSKHSTERVTIDLDLQFRNDEDTRELHNLVIAEVKQEKYSISSPFIRAMKKYKIREGSVSKYCFGVIALFQGIKHNNFKLKVSQLNKLAHATR
ncbi:MAG: polyphosphate polymerase domain-containing protein [Flavobacteriales bacterium]|nr:polyphosphate polymerase domain-containing protein [Flavobacteriales bacterium]MCB9448377.1 polyphosphate polymerase domain-containing protein [Flavobacteriales bacterium]